MTKHLVLLLLVNLFLQQFGIAQNDSLKTFDGPAMQYSIQNGIIQTGEAKLRDLRDNIQKLTGMNVQVSIIKQGGAFDNGAQIPIQAAVPGGVH